MSTSAPKIDNRTAADIVAQVQDLLVEKKYAPAWQEFDVDPLTGKRIPRGVSAALINIFGRFAEIVIQRLNQAPDKNFLAFLDLLGAAQLPPQPARAPLTFTLAANSPTDAVVPAGTQVAAPPVERGQVPVIFETERELVVTAARLAALVTRDPRQDRYTMHSPLASQSDLIVEHVFEGNQQIEHLLYIGHSELLAFPKIEQLILHIEPATPIAGDTPWELQWEFYDGRDWKPKKPQSDTTDRPTQPGQITFDDDLTAVPISTVNNQSNRWLRCRLMTPITPTTQQLPSIRSLALQVVINRTDLLIEQAFANQLPLDPSKAFYPFGEQPKIGDTLYLTNSEAFATAGATVTLNVELSNPVAGDAVLKWEFGNGDTWIDLKVSDKTEAFTKNKDGVVTFNVPPQPRKTMVNGVEGYWLRVRIISGSYGSAAYYERNRPQFLFTIAKDFAETLDKRSISDELLTAFATQAGITLAKTALVSVEQAGRRWLIIDTESKRTHLVELSGQQLAVSLQIEGFTLVPAAFTPPLIASIKVQYDLNTEQPPMAKQTPMIVTYNDFSYTTITEGERPFAPFETTAQTPEDQQPALYFGFTLPAQRKQFPNSTLSLFVRLADVSYGQSPDNPAATATPRLVWEYWNGAWTRLMVRDETSAFTRSGLIEFLPPADIAPRTGFLTPADTMLASKERPEYYWIRVRRASGDYQFAPRLRYAMLNTTTATQTVTIRNEILGSSDASKQQLFQTTRMPVLPNQQLEVREPEMPSAAEQSTIEQEEGLDAISRPADTSSPTPTNQKVAPERLAPVGRTTDVWIRWHEVPDFHASGPRDRHYVLNHLTGEITFGNGLNGLIPPPGISNLRMAHYRTGGGVAGNRAANSIVQLKTTVPYVAAVSNPEAAAGGAEAETLDVLRERAPRMIRHRQRAVTIEDYADLARLASPEVARARCVPLYDLAVDPDAQQRKPGSVSLIIVPRGDDPKPVPSIELLNSVRDYLDQHRLPGVDLTVVGPDYVRVDVKAEVSLASLEGASQIELDIVTTLARFLHPLTGGLDNAGWDFGRKPHNSDLYVVIEGIPGVDHVRSLAVEEIAERPGANQTDRFLVYSGIHTITLTFGEP